MKIIFFITQKRMLRLEVNFPKNLMKLLDYGNDFIQSKMKTLKLKKVKGVR